VPAVIRNLEQARNNPSKRPSVPSNEIPWRIPTFKLQDAFVGSLRNGAWKKHLLNQPFDAIEALSPASYRRGDVTMRKPVIQKTKTNEDLDTMNRFWYRALEELDKKGDKRQLVSLLRSGRPSDVVSFHIADLLERYDLGKKRGRPRVPSYDMSDAERKVLRMKEQVGDLIKGGMKAENAIAKVAQENKMSAHTVANAHGGRRGSTRRLKQRMPKPTKSSEG
jgi:hypothetical protein